MLNYAIIGFGGLGKSHFRNYEAIKNIVGDLNLVALCDVEESAFKTQTAINLSTNEVGLDLSSYNLYNDVAELLKKEKLDFIVTALPTYIHEKIAVMALEKGIHVFSEKPIAINLEQAQNMIDKAKENNVKLMIGQCLRYWPEYVMLKDIIDSKKYGNVVYGDFKRLSGTPVWSWQDWMRDETKSGGCALDMHVHDIDFINYVFGKPKAVTARAINQDVKHDLITATLDYDDKYFTVTAGWGLKQSYPFTAEFLIRFDTATVEVKNGKFNIYTDNGAEEIAVPAGNAYVNELVDFITCIRENKDITINPPESSKISIEIALAEKLSADKKETIKL